MRGEIYPEDVLASVAAMRLGRPIKWIEDRRESLIATNHSRDQKSRIRAAVDSRGFILGLDVQYWAGQGGYIRTHGVTVHDMAAAMLPGPYRVPAYRVNGPRAADQQDAVWHLPRARPFRRQLCA